MLTLIRSEGVAVRVGSKFSCKYPKHGTRNILCLQEGEIEKIGRSANGQFVILKRNDGSYRTLNVGKMVGPVAD